MASNLLLGTLNRLDSATLSGGSWQSTLPLSNLQDRRLSKLARTVDNSVGSTQFTLDFGQARNVGLIALVAHNLSVTASIQIYGDDAADFATPLYDSGSVAIWPSGVIPQELLEWEDDNFWLGTLSQEALAGFNAPWIHILATAQTLRYWKIAITDTANPDGYAQLGRVYIGSVWNPEIGRSYGASLGYEDTSVIEASIAGEEFFDVRRKRRIHDFELGWLTETEYLNKFLELQRLQGTTGEVLIVPDLSDTTNAAKVSFLGRLKSLDAATQHAPTAWSCNLSVQEVL